MSKKARLSPAIDSEIFLPVWDFPVAQREIIIAPPRLRSLNCSWSLPSLLLANSLYIEWFSERNGRVVIESADYELTISTPEWRMTPGENEQRARDDADGLNDFMQEITGSYSDG